jgi:ParB family chromosome partitioning protein
MSQVQVLRVLPLEAILPNPSQPRRHFDEVALQALAGSLQEKGVLQPVLVRPLKDGMYQLVAGERRWRAAKIAGLPSIPALVSHHDDLAALEIALIENLAREDLNPVEEARAFATLVNEFGLTQEQVGQRTGRSRGAVTNMIRLLKLHEEAIELIDRGELNMSHGKVLLSVKDLDARLPLARAAVEEGWSVRTLEARASASNLDALSSQQDRSEQAQVPKQAQARGALDVARVWGDLLGVEVHVRPLPRWQMRMEVVFGSAAEGIALADRLAAAITRGSKGS